MRASALHPSEYCLLAECPLLDSPVFHAIPLSFLTHYGLLTSVVFSDGPLYSSFDGRVKPKSPDGVIGKWRELKRQKESLGTCPRRGYLTPSHLLLVSRHSGIPSASLYLPTMMLCLHRGPEATEPADHRRRRRGHEAVLIFFPLAFSGVCDGGGARLTHLLSSLLTGDRGESSGTELGTGMGVNGRHFGR